MPTLSVAHPVFYPMATEGSYCGLQHPEDEVHIFKPNTTVGNAIKNFITMSEDPTDEQIIKVTVGTIAFKVDERCGQSALQCSPTSNFRNTKQKDMKLGKQLFYPHSCKNLKSNYVMLHVVTAVNPFYPLLSFQRTVTTHYK
jgi:hypothetical protein